VQCERPARQWNDHSLGAGRYRLQYKRPRRKGSGTARSMYMVRDPVLVILARVNSVCMMDEESCVVCSEGFVTRQEKTPKEFV